MGEVKKSKGYEQQDENRVEKQMNSGNEVELVSESVEDFSQTSPGIASAAATSEQQEGFRFTIGKKLGVGFALALTILVVIGTISFRSIDVIMEDVKMVSQANLIVKKISSLDVALANASRGVRGYVLTGNESFLEAYLESQKEYKDLFNEIKGLVKVEQQQRLLEKMEPVMQAEFDFLREVIDTYKNKGVEAAVEMIKTNKGEKIMVEFNNIVDEFQASQMQILEERRDNQKASESAADSTIIFGTLFAFLLLSLVGVLITRNITVNLKKVVDGLNKSAQVGDLTQAVALRTSDELGVLAGSFNAIQRTFHSIVSRIANASLKIMSTSNELLAAANQQESTTQEQSSQINQIQSTLNEFASTSAEVSQTTKELSRLVTETSKESQHGTALIKDANEKMKFIGDSNQSVASKLKMLNDNIEGIGKMLTVILSVADQTNLLSLNAAIEAAKAGEHGKGFSVVAQEIRRLADQTAQSSKEISSLINTIQASSSSVLMAMEKSSQDIKGGIGIVEDMASRFLAISDRVQNVSSQFEVIVSSVQEQASGQKEISSSMVQMAEALRLTASSAKQVGKSAYDLTALGHQLRSAVGQFKLR